MARKIKGKGRDWKEKSQTYTEGASMKSVKNHVEKEEGNFILWKVGFVALIFILN